MGFEYVGMWAFHNIAVTQMEGGKGDSNPTHPISKWVPMDSWLYWFKCRHLELNIYLVEGLDISKPKV
jgi:hypothetical protein